MGSKRSKILARTHKDYGPYRTLGKSNRTLGFDALGFDWMCAAAKAL